MPLYSRRDLDGSQGKTVCVMDASTYVGFWIVQGLLQRGYTVHAAVQDGGDVESLIKLSGERLKVLYVEMLDYHSILDALRGCFALFYTFELPQYDEMMVEIEVRAAHNVLEACAQTETIEKVVFTSSVAAVVWREDGNSVSDIHERHWSDVNLCRKLKLWYAAAKTLAERTAWALAMDRGVNMVTINTALVVGPGSAYKTKGSTIAYLKGAAQMYENGVLASADARFVAEAHICAYEHPSAYGRYICFDQIVNSAKNANNLAETLRSLIPFPERCEDPTVYQQRLSNKKLSGLMAGYKE
uniref:3-beta hydroxysteroid dehydrogenase/isomerase domain-containing protein n=1 Tax=Araucaria cunninghamii TaxID=56994 RepID=A0A0D6QTL8_ARACU